MAKYTVDVACFHCHTPNRVQIGVEFYEAKAWYVCHSCKRSAEVRITQKNLAAPDADSLAQIQIGEHI